MFTLLLLYYYIIFFMYSNNLEGRQGSDLIQYSAPWEYELTNKQTISPHDSDFIHSQIQKVGLLCMPEIRIWFSKQKKLRAPVQK